MDVVLFGPPGSGKGTQSNLLAGKLGAKHLSTGDLFREILEDKSHPLYTKVQIIKEGKLVSDDVVNLVVEDGIQKPEYQNGIIFDGYPRTIYQAKALDRMLSDMGRKIDLVIDLNVSQDVILFRILGRLVCPKCKQVFHKKQGLSNCPNCGEGLVSRTDDTEEVIVKRMQEYEANTAPLHDYYNNSQTIHITLSVDDTSLSVKGVNDQIMAKLKEKGIIQ